MIDINDLVEVLSNLPGIGKKSASRITFFLLKNKNNAIELSNTISNIINNIKICSICGNFTINDPCKLCSSSNRDDSIICVIEDPRDLIAIEETGFYKGRYHILMGSINPLEGIGPENLRINELIKRIKNGNFAEILIATNPTTEGESTFLYLVNILQEYNIKISRLATGLPMGGSLEFSDKFTLSKAIQSKIYMHNH